MAKHHNIPFHLSDLMVIYVVQRSPAYERYYFARQPEYPPLIGNLSDSERHTCELVIVWGNYEKAPRDESTWSIPGAEGGLVSPRAHTCIFSSMHLLLHLLNIDVTFIL